MSVTIPHPPAHQVNLNGKRLAFEQTGGTCAQGFEDEVTRSPESKGIELINRGDLDAFL